MVPAGTPQAIVEKLNQMWKPVIDGEETRAFMAKFGADTLSISPEAAQKQLIQEVEDWAGYVKLANIEPMG
jgi:tripartite-type tricarboxylate transporter receptor subunit TctC